MARENSIATRVPSVVYDSRRIAYNSKSPEVLAEQVQKYGFDFEVCCRAANNSSANADVLKLVMDRVQDIAAHLNAMKQEEEFDEDFVVELERRMFTLTRILAQRSEEFEVLPRKEKLEILRKLSESSDPETRKNLARYTKSEEIKVLLYRSVGSNYETKGICLKRLHGMDTLKRYISKLSGENLYKYADYILRNTHLTKEVLISFIEASVMLDDAHIELIMDNPNYNEEEFGELLSKFKHPEITNK